MDIIVRILGKIVEQNTLEDLLVQISTIMMEEFNSEVCSIFLRAEDNPNIIMCYAGTGYAKNLLEAKAKYEVGEGFTGSIIQDDKSYNIKNLNELNELKKIGKWDKKYNVVQFGEKLSSTDEDFRNLMACPLKVGDDIIGVIKVENKIPDNYNFKNVDILRNNYSRCELEYCFFDDDDFEAFKLVSNIMALSMKYRILQKERKLQSEANRRLVYSLVKGYKIEDIIGEFLDFVLYAYDVEASSVYLFKDKILDCVGSKGYAKQIKGRFYEEGEGITWMIFSEKIPVLANTPDELACKYSDFHKGKLDSELWSGDFKFRNLLAYPLLNGQNTLGVVKLENKKQGDFTTDDLERFKEAAEILALAIQNARNYQNKQRDFSKQITLMASHKINNLISNYDGVARKMACMDVVPIDLVKRLRDATARLKSITVDIGKLTVDSKSFKMSPTNINELLLDSLGETSDYTNVSVEFLTHDIAQQPIYLTCDKQRMQDVFAELIRNSIKAAIDNNVKITIGVHESIRENKPGVDIVFQDNGRGIPSQFDIFEPFKTTTTDGTGLGLSTVKEIIEAHNGIIESVPCEKGARFVIFMPNNIYFK